MLLYIWVNHFRHIKKTGFNLCSNFEFDFQVEDDDTKRKNISGRLTCVKKNNPHIFDESIKDIRAIIGENGAGKSTLFEIIIQNIMTPTKIHFDGFIITDKYIFNRNGINFGTSINDIKHFNLIEVSNTELVNFKRDQFKRKLTVDEVQDHHHGQIATSHLDHLSIIHYSPLLNIDRILNVEGVAGSARNWETDYWHYYDYTTENCIVDDYNSYNTAGSNYYITGESELLAHKSSESKRNLEFLSVEIFNNLPFKNRIKSISISLNNFYQRFWESIDSYLKSDNELLGSIEQVLNSIEDKSTRQKIKVKELESNLYMSFIYAALKFEYTHRMNFGDRSSSNAIVSTIQLFLETTRNNRFHKTSLESFLKKARFAVDFNIQIFDKIKKAVEFILTSENIINRRSDDFEIQISNPETVKEFIKLFYDDFLFTNGEDSKAFVFQIFSIEYTGLSSGERNLLSMFSRIKKAADNIPASQTEVVFLLDEPEVTLHPQWQTSFIKIINENLPKLFNKKNLQILISSHSPILISDLPKNHILFMAKDDITGDCKVSHLRSIKNTFGANIHTLYADAFFLKDKGGAMGQFAKEIIYKIIKDLNNPNVENPTYIKSIIELIGEPLIYNQLIELFYNKFPEQRIENMDERILFLEQELKTMRTLKENSQ